MRNPFSPTPGKTPPLLVGRDQIIADFNDSLEEGPGAPGRFSLLVGARGVGKTVMLNVLEDEAKKESWYVYSETASKGFVNRLVRVIKQTIDKHVEREGEKILESLDLNFMGVGAGFKFAHSAEAENLTLRESLTILTDLQNLLDQRIGQEPIGILITLDELHQGNREEVIEFATTMQHMTREDRNVAVVMAGIPSAVNPLLADDNGSNPITFLRRAERYDLGKIPDAQVADGLNLPVNENGKQWDDEALQMAVQACDGYAFTIQLVGYHCFKNAQSSLIDVETTSEGIEKALKRLGSLVFSAALKDCSDVDRTFLVAMSLDDDSTAVSDIALRLNESAQYVNQYRQRLIEQGLIEPDGRGRLRFSNRALRDYLKEHYANEVFKMAVTAKGKP
ncbi:hypothetical protein BSR29_01490 [Boudabousia liubingyangii]|uniref:Orc1-like AAA ATPase domain-containing protein n=1 Tax=Boudabousia liubingyangii TaxID=1921764 RepID=A0A1Q5PQ61_9ACTO|nr:ATP-binding protein [Boudabousia liubingyangii]OKL49656.1 hypothetical protein BSR29_01490 [Boudabousia liubingyangii]